MSEDEAVNDVTKFPVDEHKLEVIFSRDLLASVPNVPQEEAACRGVPDWVKPRTCGHKGSQTVKYTWEWRTARYFDPVVEQP